MKGKKCADSIFALLTKADRFIIMNKSKLSLAFFFFCQLDDYYTYLSAKDASSKTYLYVKNGVIPASTIQIYFQKDEEK